MRTAASPWSTRRVLHDLAGHLRAAQGSLQLVPAQERAHLGARPQRALTLAEESLTAALALLEETTTRARGSAAASERIDVRQLAASVARELAQVFPHAKVEVTEVPAALADEVALRRVVLNLVTNACVHAGPTPRIRIGGAAEPPHVRVDVADDGPGIDPRDQLILFLPKPDSAPHGHGLPNALHLVAEQGGRLWLDSAPGRGTTVHFTLPAA